MFTPRWSVWIEQPFDPESIKAEANRMERRYWFWIAVCAALEAMGIVGYFMTSDFSMSGAIVSLFLALVGILLIVMMKLWAHVMLATMRIALIVGKR